MDITDDLVNIGLNGKWLGADRHRFTTRTNFDEDTCRHIASKCHTPLCGACGLCQTLYIPEYVIMGSAATINRGPFY